MRHRSQKEIPFPYIYSEIPQKYVSGLYTDYEVKILDYTYRHFEEHHPEINKDMQIYMPGSVYYGLYGQIETTPQDKYFVKLFVDSEFFPYFWSIYRKYYAHLMASSF